MGFENLPYEVLQNIFSKFDSHERLRASLLNCYWRSFLLSKRNLHSYQLVIETESQLERLSENLRSNIQRVRFRPELIAHRRKECSEFQLCKLVTNTLAELDSVFSVDLSVYHISNTSDGKETSGNLAEFLEHAPDSLAKVKELRTHHRASSLVHACKELMRLSVISSLHLDPSISLVDYVELLGNCVADLAFHNTIFNDMQPLVRLVERTTRLHRLDLGSQVMFINLLPRGKYKDSDTLLADLTELLSRNNLLRLTVALSVDANARDQDLRNLIGRLGNADLAITIAGTDDNKGQESANFEIIPFNRLISLKATLSVWAFRCLATFVPASLDRLTQMELNLPESNSSEWLTLIRAARSLEKLKLVGAVGAPNGEHISTFHLDVIAQHCRSLRSLILARVNCSLMHATSEGRSVCLSQLETLELQSVQGLRHFRLLTPYLRKFRLSVQDSRESAEAFLAFWSNVSASSGITHVDVEIYLEEDAFLTWLDTLSHLRFLRTLTFRHMTLLKSIRTSSSSLTRLIEALRACKMLRFFHVWLVFADRRVISCIEEAVPLLQLADPGEG